MTARIVAALLTLTGGLSAQPLSQWDSSGNAQLNGIYNFRQVIWLPANARGDLRGALAFFGTITFNGGGTYTMSCQFVDSGLLTNGGLQTCPSLTGSYRVSAGGIARLSAPVGSLIQRGDIIEGLITNGVLLGSTTEVADYNDIFVAAKAPESAPTSDLLNGRYWIGNFDTPSSSVATFRDSLFAANFDGAGGIENVQATGYIGANGSTAITQSISGARYSFSSSVGTIAFGGTLSSTNLLAGNRSFFTSPDGSFLFGGSTAGFDILIGIRSPSGSVGPEVTGGLFYEAGVSSDQSFLSQNATIFHSYYASFLTNGNFRAGHQRVQDLSADVTYDYTYTASYNFADGIYEDTPNGFRYAVSPDGKFQLGIGKGPIIGLDVAVRADFAGPGVFVNPGLILNAASFVPSTAGVSRGELVTLVGTGLATTSVVDAKFPTSLGGAIVLVNGRPAPLYEVSPTRITAQIPFTTTEQTATITIVSNGQTSAPIMLYLRGRSPGVFLVGGSYAAALHADFSVITKESPAKPGEAIQVFVTGFGDVSPTVNAGTPAPSDPLSLITTTVAAYLGDKNADIYYKGLAPGLTGIYQLNIQIPTTTQPGDVELLLSTSDSLLFSSRIPVGPSAGQ